MVGLSIKLDSPIFFMKKIILSLLTSIFLISFTFSEETDNRIIINTDELPVIETLVPARANLLLKEYSSIVESNSQAVASGQKPENIFFKYKNTEKFTFQGLAARCCITQETLATLNHIENAQDDITNKTLILPTINGLFIPVDKGTNSIEVLLQENYTNENLTKYNICYNIDGKEYRFFLNKRFTPTERAYFLDSALRLPLDHDSFWISSEFGKRQNPFSGQMKNHNGIDMAAPDGTPVYAIKDGAAYCCIYDDPEFGNYIILSHDQGKLTSVYAHLSDIKIEQYQNVKKGDLIGYVGHSGMATGPHLHFEIRQGGKAQDPKLKLRFDK